MRNNSKTIGDLAELRTAALFASMGYFVSKPLTDNAPYDLIVDNGALSKVQVKARSIRNDKITVEMRTTMVNYTSDYSKSDFDILAVYNIDTEEIALLNWLHLKEGCDVVLRTAPTKNNQSKGIKFFSDFIPR